VNELKARYIVLNSSDEREIDLVRDETGITQLKDAVFMAGLKYLFSFDNPLSDEAVRGMLDVMGRAFDDLGDCMENSDRIKEANDQMKGMGMTEKTLKPKNSQNSEKTENIQKDEKKIIKT
jgi:hypothetical protein